MLLSLRLGEFVCVDVRSCRSGLLPLGYASNNKLTLSHASFAALVAYPTEMLLGFRITAANTGAMTLAVLPLAAKPFVDVTGDAFVGGEFQIGDMVFAAYNSTNNQIRCLQRLVDVAMLTKANSFGLLQTFTAGAALNGAATLAKQVIYPPVALTSGGDIRDFFRLLGAVLVKAANPAASLPVSDSALANAENAMRREMLPIPDTHKDWLKRIAQSHQSELANLSDLATFAGFLDSRVVLNYRNGKDWYDVHPLLWEVIDAHEPRSPAAG